MVAETASIIDGRCHKHMNWLLTPIRLIIYHKFIYMNVTWPATTVVCKQIIKDNKKCRHIAGDFGCHVDQAIWWGVHHSMEHIQGFTWSPWMPPSVECLRRISPAAAMVDKFEWNTQSTNKTQLLPSNYGTFNCKLIMRISRPKTDPLRRSSMQWASFKCETPWFKLKSMRTFLATKSTTMTSDDVNGDSNSNGSAANNRGSTRKKLLDPFWVSQFTQIHVNNNKIPVKYHCKKMTTSIMLVALLAIWSI